MAWLVTGQLSETVSKLTEYRTGLQVKAASVREFFEAPFRESSKTVQDLGKQLSPPTQPGPTDGVIPVRIEERTLGFLSSTIGERLEDVA